MSTVVAKNLAVQNSEGTASTNISFDGTKLVSTALDNSITTTANLHDLGVGQTWQDVTGSRAAGTTYTNSTGKPIVVHVFLTTQSGAYVNIYVNGSVLAGTGGGSGASHFCTAIVPNGSTYVVVIGGVVSGWRELR